MKKKHFNEFETLRRVCGENRVSFLNSALTFFDWAVKEVSKGRTIASIDKSTGEPRKLEFEPLKVVARKRQEKLGLQA